MKKTLLLVIFSILTVFSSGCRKLPVYHLQREAVIQELGICLKYQSDTLVPYAIRTRFDHTLNRFIENYNAGNHSFRLTTCQNPEQMSLRLTIYETRLVSSEKQAAGVFVSLLGFATPFILAGAGSPFIVTFWYFPKDMSAVENSLSEDLRAGSSLKSFAYVSNSGFLRSPQKQVIKHTEAFEQFLLYHVNEVEKAYIKSKNTPANMPIR